MARRVTYRALFALVLVGCLAVTASAYVGSSAGDSGFEGKSQSEVLNDRSEQVVPERDGVTVAGMDSNSWRGDESDGPRGRAELVAYAPNGSVLYYNDTHTRYWDVDPVPGTEATVEVAYADHVDGADCPDADEWDPADHGVDEDTWNEYYDHHGGTDACTRNGVERVNLSTGEVTPVWSRQTPGKEATRYHDVDRVNDTHLLVADIYLDRVFVVDETSDETVWTWNASDEFDPAETGGPHPDDWSHINDVELVDDGSRVMVSVRNHDRVAFVDRETGELDEDWTLGAEDDYDVLNEQHNPDYIPEENGGPAVLVADSENNRVVEYQRENGEWVQSWQWQDARAQWVRDADRLPNGHTLITDSNGNRLLEVDTEGEVVWSTRVGFPYEAERFDPGDESSGGPSAERAGLESHTGGPVDRFWIGVKDVLPGKYLNGLMYVTPVWLGVGQLSALLVALVATMVWGVLEYRWRT
ncbi:arylsulfotransferase family protein [Halorarum salinum]|uniref:Aryl-sulfate sulfotransferase n=1 Tax=Halorarum salinum TaxID=2743089 RepID=A0A7D5L9M7_9EURY|nr:arylsulfotransferase family protein [Halobaculum salinum]QLG61247.1 aryl-sulfate sulfotransferase [Halobaculum salinum]